MNSIAKENLRIITTINPIYLHYESKCLLSKHSNEDDVENSRDETKGKEKENFVFLIISLIVCSSFGWMLKCWIEEVGGQSSSSCRTFQFCLFDTFICQSQAWVFFKPRFFEIFSQLRSHGGRTIASMDSSTIDVESSDLIDFRASSWLNLTSPPQASKRCCHGYCDFNVFEERKWFHPNFH